MRTDIATEVSGSRGRAETMIAQDCNGGPKRDLLLAAEKLDHTTLAQSAASCLCMERLLVMGSRTG